MTDTLSNYSSPQKMESQVDQTVQNSNKNKTNYWIYSTFILLFILVSGGYYFLSKLTMQNNIDDNCNPLTTPIFNLKPTEGIANEPTTPITPSAMPIYLQKNYVNENFKFSLQIPNNTSVSQEMNTDYNRLVTFEGDNLLFKIHLEGRKDLEVFDPHRYYHMDMMVSEVTTLGELEAGLYKAPNGYCDGPGCSQPYVAIVTKKDNDIYTLSFYGDDELSPTENAILQSFRFTE